MQFNNTTDINGIIQLCERYCNFPVAGISGTTNTLKEFTAYANEANREAWVIAHKNYGGWQYEDSNQIDLPIATATLTSDQANYSIPSTALIIRNIEVKNESGAWRKLVPLTYEQINETGAISEFEETDGKPRYYSLMNDTITLYPAPDYTQASSLKVYYERGSHDFVYTDTTQTPGFASEFHGMIPVGASMRYWFAKPQGNDAYNKLMMEYEKIKKNMGDYYSERWKEKFPPKVMVRDYLKENI
jgi:hypothetical protein